MRLPCIGFLQSITSSDEHKQTQTGLENLKSNTHAYAREQITSAKGVFHSRSQPSETHIVPKERSVGKNKFSSCLIRHILLCILRIP
jgi:tRNA A37 N6-isopentenylltransferase MiaA